MQITSNLRLGAFWVADVHYERGLELPEHTHPLGGFCIVVSGRYRESYGARVLTCERASMTYRTPGALHANVYDDETRCIALEADEAWLRRFAELDTLRTGAIADGRLISAARAIAEELQAPDASSELMIEGLALQLAAMCARRSRQTPSATGSAWLRRVRERIEEEIRTPSLRDLAGDAGVHPSHVAAAFHKAFGCSVGEYARRTRVDRAARQLVATDVPIVDVALDNGFANQSHFTRVFRSILGVPPAAYRRQRK